MKRAWVILFVTAIALTWNAYHVGSVAEASNASPFKPVTIAATDLASPSLSSAAIGQGPAPLSRPLLLAHGQPFRLENGEMSGGDNMKELPSWWSAGENGEENGDEEEGEGDEDEDAEEEGDEGEKEDPYERMWNAVTLG